MDVFVFVYLQFEWAWIKRWTVKASKKVFVEIEILKTQERKNLEVIEFKNVETKSNFFVFMKV